MATENYIRAGVHAAMGYSHPHHDRPVPLLRYVDSKNEIVTAWARLPRELLDMLLLVGMGALGGVIAVTRCFVDNVDPESARTRLSYRPVGGAMIALGIYVLFRATQLFFGGGAATVSTSVFLLAALGLASGFCARGTVAQIEVAARRILHRAESVRDDDHHGTSPRVTPTGSSG